MSVPILDLLIKISADTKEVDDNVDKSKEGAFKFASSFKDALGNVAKIGAGAFAAVGTAVTAFTKQTIDSFGEYEQLVGGVQKIFGNAGQTIEEYAQANGKSVDAVREEWTKLEDAQNTVINNAEKAFLTSGMSMNDYMQTATGFSGALIKSLNGDTQKAAEITDIAMQAMSDNVNTFGTDAGLVSNAFMGLSRQNYMMIDNLKLGYAGTAQGMMELINDSGVLGKTLKSTSELADVGFDQMIMAIQKVQEQQGIAGTTAREALKTIEGSATATKKAWENVITAIGKGEGLGNALEGLSTALFGTGGDDEGYINQIIPRIQTIMESVGEFVAEAGPIIAEKFPELFNSIFPSLFETTTTLVASLASTIPDIITLLFPVLMDSATTLISTLVGYIMENLPLILSTGVTLLSNLAQGIRENLPTLISTAFSIMADFIGEVLNALPDIIGAGIELILALSDGIVKSTPDFLKAIGEILSDAWDAITGYDWLSLGKAIIDGIVSGITGFGGAIWNALSGAVSGAFKGVKNFFGISSPSKLMKREIGRFIPLGLAEGIDDTADSVYEAMDELANGTVDAYDPLFDDVFNESVEKSGGDGLPLLLEEVKNLKDAILGMNVVLDTGATVGALAPAMDNTLGSFSVYKGRGN